MMIFKLQARPHFGCPTMSPSSRFEAVEKIRQRRQECIISLMEFFLLGNALKIQEEEYTMNSRKDFQSSSSPLSTLRIEFLCNFDFNNFFHYQFSKNTFDTKKQFRNISLGDLTSPFTLNLAIKQMNLRKTQQLITVQPQTLPQYSNSNNHFSKQTNGIISQSLVYSSTTYLQDMTQIIRFILVLGLISCFNCNFGVDVSQLFSVENYTCMKNSNITFVVARGYCSFGGMDTHAVTSLTNIKTAGLKGDTYMFPCRGKNATAQVNQLLANIPANLYDTVWIDVQTNPSSGCSWSGHDGASNCQFVLELLSEFKVKNKKVGIYASRYMWGTIFGSYEACGQASVNIPLWYAHYDNVPSFSDFIAFAGWKTPTFKQYLGTSSLCGASVDRNWHP